MAAAIPASSDVAAIFADVEEETKATREMEDKGDGGVNSEEAIEPGGGEEERQTHKDPDPPHLDGP